MAETKKEERRNGRGEVAMAGVMGIGIY